ncbi:murein hydrolase activator EnvC [Herbiconiux sp. P17]|uniref:murein hydrolase activator EnvC family protein n=1 Tax=Herbiconiux wuyangfengii TaxID=3342794 RepID=UPI0035B8D7AC
MDAGAGAGAGAAVGAASAGAGAGAGAGAVRSWQWPVGAPVVVTAEFVAPATKYSAGHRGTDLATAPGTSVLAPRDGVVAFAGAVAGRPVVSIDHPGDYRSSVEPVVATVAVGDAVRRGQVIGTVGTGGHCSAECLHFGVRLHGDYVNPRGLIGGIPRAVLLPSLAAAASAAVGGMGREKRDRATASSCARGPAEWGTPPRYRPIMRARACGAGGRHRDTAPTCAGGSAEVAVRRHRATAPSCARGPAEWGTPPRYRPIMRARACGAGGRHREIDHPARAGLRSGGTPPRYRPILRARVGGGGGKTPPRNRPIPRRRAGGTRDGRPPRYRPIPRGRK